MKLCELDSPETVAAVSCSPVENVVAVSTNQGRISIYSMEEARELKSFRPHSSRVGSLSWNKTVLASGSRDKTISLLDMRCCGLMTLGSSNLDNASRWNHSTLKGHSQEVCGLRYSPDGRYLASGGNDNLLLLWDIYGNSNTPSYTFTDHKAAVKALAWSPHKRGLLASGGGTADQEIRLWNSLTGQALSNHKTESQICNMVWSKNTNELVTTHGFSFNELIVWKYPIMSPVVKLSGHTSRVLYMALSPDGRSVVTGSGDETLRFWHLFDSNPSPPRPYSVLTLENYVR
ncbi:fizzy-related protein homolog [Octopus sinensis]|uniref:Fizzy-related protein homolog n=1 Tax=Octopus sinensis TaxID=2607531 RepID=A0A7E6ELB5_9MOLL|nr:fizzy-related protein homolog [Octopus sinensis]